jgi:hypothetical protein
MSGRSVEGDQEAERGVGGKVERDIKAGAVCVEAGCTCGRATTQYTVEYTTGHSRT